MSYLPQKVRVLVASSYLDANQRAQVARAGAVITVPGGSYLASLVADGLVEEYTLPTAAPTAADLTLVGLDAAISELEQTPASVPGKRPKKAQEPPAEV